MKKKEHSKSIMFYITIFFIFINILCFIIFFAVIQVQYYKVAQRNINESNQKATEAFKQNYERIRHYMNELTLQIYADEDINKFCRKIYQKDYEGEVKRQSLISDVRNACFKYLYYYDFVQGICICMEDEAQSNIYLGSWASDVADWRIELQQDIIEYKGVLHCFETEKNRRIIYARTLRDYENVLKDDSVIGTVMLVLSAKDVEDSLKSIGMTENSFAILKNKDNMVVASSRTGDKNRSLEEILKAEKQELEVFYTPIEALSQELVIVTPSSSVNISTIAFTQTIGLIIVLTVLLDSIIIFIVSKRLTRPIEKMVYQIQGIGIGKIENQHVVAQGYREIEDIADNFNLMLDRIENLVRENYLIGIKEKSARIEALQSQINPHFIFNTLETINWKIMFLDVPEVSNMISYLGNILRYTTYQYGKYVTVKQELAQIENYLYIQEIRYDHSFVSKILTQEDAEDISIPCLLIQPLVENAVIHGVKNKKNGIIVIQAKVCKDYLEIMVFDNGGGMNQETIDKILNQSEELEQESIGLTNVSQRICLTYNVKQGLYIKSKKDKYTRIDIRIPLEQMRRK